MTLEEIRASDAAFMTPEELAGTLGCTPQTLRVQAQEDPGKLGFPVCVMGTRVRVPRLAFLHWMDYGLAPIVRPEGR